MGDRRKRISGATFAGVTLAAVIIAVVLIALGRISSSTAEVSAPAPNPTSTILATSTPKPPSSTSPSSIPAVLDTAKGSLNAPITIIEYSDFQCAHCQEFALTIEGQLDKLYVDTGKVRFIYKFIIAYGEESLRADEAAASAAEQGQFWPYYYKLMELGASPAVDDLPLKKLEDLAQQLGLVMPTFKSSLESGKWEAYVRQDHAAGVALGVKGTPTFFINGVKQEGAPTLKVLQDIIGPMLQKLGQ